MRYKFETSKGEVVVVDDGRDISIVEGRENLDNIFVYLSINNGWLFVHLPEGQQSVPEYKVTAIDHLVSFEYKGVGGLSGNKSGTQEEVKKYAEENSKYWNSYSFFRILPSDNHIHDLQKVDL